MLRRTFLTTALIAGAAPLAAQVAGPSDPAASIVVTLATMLEEGYVIPATGRRYAAMLRTRLAAGGYAGLVGEALAVRLTADLRAVAADGHLRVLTTESLPAGQRPGASPVARAAPQGGPRRPPAVQDAGLLADGVAYIRFAGFTGGPPAVAATEAFMRDHAGAKALIVDCRYNGGGGMDEMNAILPYLYAAETPLVRFEMMAAVARVRGLPFEGPTVRPLAPAGDLVRHQHVAIPRADETRWRAATAFYLTSRSTGSAAEHLALAFKHTGRALLIGERTAGANHFGDFQDIGGGLAVFLPVGRTVDLTTGEDWEEKGVVPDVPIAPALALQEALRRAGVKVA